MYIARYKNVGGLEVSTNVQLNGLKIGYVREIYFAEDYSGDLIVKIAVFNKFPLPVGTTAEIANNDLLGSKVVKLSLGKSMQFYRNNDSIRTKIESDLMSQVTEQIAPIKAKAERLIVSLDSIVSGVSILMNSETRKNLSRSFEQISKTMENLEKISSDLALVIGTQKTNLSASIVNVKDLTENINKDAASLGKILSKVSAVSDSINPSEITSTLAHLNHSVKGLETLLDKVNSSSGTAGKLLTDSTLYFELSEASQNLNGLLADIKRNPHRYLKFSAIDFGKEVYLAPKVTYHTVGNIDFKVFLFHSDKQFPIDSPVFQDIRNISEVKDRSGFSYFAGEDKSYEKIRIILNNVQLSFPQASLKAFQEGKEISLKKALKICSM
ncbi:MAG: MlaD family protein [Marinilabiliales bacterium]|nr:MlaD family protein [Marinilabiliales bacterium]